jgi:hypothetical protein
MVGGEDFEAVADIVAEEGDVDVGEGGRVGLEFAEGGCEEPSGAEEIVAAEMVKGYGDLDEGLQKELFRLRGGEPDAFPDLVGFEVAGGVVEAEAFGEGAADPVDGHARAVAEGGVWAGLNMVFDPGLRVSDEAH